MLNLVITEKCVLDNLALFGQSILKFEVLNRILIQIILTEKTRALNSVKNIFKNADYIDFQSTNFGNIIKYFTIHFGVIIWCDGCVYIHG